MRRATIRPNKPLVIRTMDTGSGVQLSRFAFVPSRLAETANSLDATLASKPPIGGAGAGEASPVSLKEAELSIMAGNSVDGAASMVSSDAGLGPGKVEASEMQAARRPAESIAAARLSLLLLENVILFMSSASGYEIEVCGIAKGKARLQRVPTGA